MDQIIDAPPVLDCLEGQTVNIDELDFLMRSIDRFDENELAKFQAMAVKRDIAGIEDLINLSFCSEKATVITAFNDLEAAGRRHMFFGGEEVFQAECSRTQNTAAQ